MLVCCLENQLFTNFFLISNMGRRNISLSFCCLAQMSKFNSYLMMIWCNINMKIKWKIHNAKENCSASEIVIAVYGWRKLCTLTLEANNENNIREEAKKKSATTLILIIKVMWKEKKEREKQCQCHYKGWYYTIWVILNKVKCTLKKIL